MLIPISCDCGRVFRVDENKIGKKGRCPACGATFRISLPSGEPSNNLDEIEKTWIPIDQSEKSDAPKDDESARPFWKDPVFQWGSVLPVLVLGWFSFYLASKYFKEKAEAEKIEIAQAKANEPPKPVTPAATSIPPVIPQHVPPAPLPPVMSTPVEQMVADLKEGESAILYDFLLSEFGLIYLSRDFQAIQDLDRFGNGKDPEAIKARMNDGRIAATFSGAKVRVGRFLAPEDCPPGKERGLYRIKILDGPYKGWSGLADGMDLRPVPDLMTLPPGMKRKDLDESDETTRVINRGKATLHQDKQIFKEVHRIHAEFRDKGKDEEDNAAIEALSKKYNIDVTTGGKIMAVGIGAKWPKD